MIAAQGILTSRGGTNSHAAVVARGDGQPGVCGADAIERRHRGRGRSRAGRARRCRGRRHLDRRLHRQRLRRRGAAGGVRPREGALRGRRGRAARSDDLEGVRAADGARRRAPAPAGARQRRHARGRRPTPASVGAEGIGLCRTEHMFLGERAASGRAADLRRDDARRSRPPTTRCCRCSATTSSSIFEAMDGLPVTVRLLDPPLHEFLPDLTELVGRGRAGRASAARTSPSRSACSQKVQRLHEAEPDARPARRAPRHRQARACSRCRSARSSRPPADASKAGGDPQAEIMIPLVATRAGARSRCATSSSRSPRESSTREGVELDHLEWAR